MADEMSNEAESPVVPIVIDCANAVKTTTPIHHTPGDHHGHNLAHHAPVRHPKSAAHPHRNFNASSVVRG